MLMWCASGVVMLFVHYPELDEGHRVQALAPIDWRGCCQFPPVAASQPIANASVEALAGTPMLRLEPEGGPPAMFDLRTGAPVTKVGQDVAEAVAAGYGPLDELRIVDRDQWTVSGEFNPHRPLYKVALADRARTEIYVSSKTGEAVQATTGAGRFWNWLGSVPHWLYPTVLRSHPAVWTQVVIWTSLLGCFLTATGLYVGWAAFRPFGDRRWSGYRRVWLWHHLAGLVFGVLTLTWVASGLVSMNPWGFLEGSGGGAARARLQGPHPTWAQVRDAISGLAAHPPAGPTLRVSTAPFGGKLYLVSAGLGGQLVRHDGAGAPISLSAADLADAARRLADGRTISSATVVTRQDAYYFSHHSTVRLPAYRLILKGGERDYLDPRTGQLLARFDADARGYRWLHEGLHRWDFVPGARQGPVWAAVMVLLLSGVTLGVGAGVWLSWKAALRDLRRLTRRRR